MRISAFTSFEDFVEAMIGCLRDRVNIKAQIPSLKECEHTDLAQTLTSNAWIVKFVEPQLLGMTDTTINGLTQGSAIPFHYRLVYMIILAQMREYLKKHPSESRSAAEKNQFALFRKLEDQKLRDIIPLYQLAIDSTLIRFGQYTHGQSAAAEKAAAAAVPGAVPAATPPVAAPDATGTGVATMKLAETEPQKDTGPQKRDALGDMTGGPKRVKAVKVTAVLAVDSDAEDILPATVVVKTDQKRARPTNLDGNVEVLTTKAEMIVVLDSNLCVDVLSSWKTIKRNSKRLSEQNPTNGQMSAISKRLTRFREFLAQVYPDEQTKFRARHHDLYAAGVRALVERAPMRDCVMQFQEMSDALEALAEAHLETEARRVPK